MIIHSWCIFLANFGPPLRPRIFGILPYQAYTLNPSLDNGTSPKMGLVYQFFSCRLIFLAKGHFGHFQCSLGPFNRGKQPLGAPQRPPEVINILRYAYHNHKIPPPQKNSCLLFLGHLNKTLFPSVRPSDRERQFAALFFVSSFFRLREVAKNRNFFFLFE